MKKTGLFIILLTTMLFAEAQENMLPDQETKNLLRSNGMIYVVISVMLLILAGVMTYLIRIDRKITRAEQRHEQDSN